MKRQTTARLAFEGGRNVYNPHDLKAFSLKELQHEYSRLRSIARKRLERFEGTEWTATQQYKQNKGKFKPVKEISSDVELRHLLTDVADFVTKQTGSVSGLKIQRELAIETYHRHGYDFVNKANYLKFVDFMAYASARNTAHKYDSGDEAREVFEKNQDKSIEELHKALDDWLEEREEKGRIQHQKFKGSQLYRREYKKR